MLKNLSLIKRAFAFTNFLLKIVQISIWSLRPESTVPDLRASEGTFVDSIERRGKILLWKKP